MLNRQIHLIYWNVLTSFPPKDLCILKYPILCECVDVDGAWILVNLIEFLPPDRWQAIDEDGKQIIVLAKDCRNPTI